MTTDLSLIHSLDLIHGIEFVKVEYNGKVFTGPLFRITERSPSSQNPFVSNTGLRADLRAEVSGMDAKEEVEVLSRDDFDFADDYARYLLNAGLLPESSYTPKWIRGASGTYVERFRAAADLKPTQVKAPKSPNHIAASDFENVYRAIAFSNWRGVVLNVHLTIVWETVGIKTDRDVRKCLEKFLERFRKWNKERSVPTCWVYVQERVPSRGLHTHILARVDVLFRANFEKWVLRCIKTVSGRAPVQQTPKEKTVVIRHKANDAVSVQWKLFPYLMKGIDPSAEIADVKDRRKQRPITEVGAIRNRKQGTVLTKRVGVSRSIDRAARLAWSFRCALDDGAISPEQLYTDNYWRDYLAWREQQDKDKEIKEVLRQIETVGF